MNFNLTSRSQVRAALACFWHWINETHADSAARLRLAQPFLVLAKNSSGLCTPRLLDEIARAELALQAAKAKEGWW